jgi:asparagine synthase (glutamine-hydrolysing)
VTVLYSGGLDSSLVAYCLGHRGASIRLSVVGTADAPDLAAAETGARMLGRPLDRQLLTTAQIRDAADELSPELGRVPQPDRSVRLTFALAIRSAPGTMLACGQGADELFGGYAHFRGLQGAAAEARRREDLRRLLTEEWPWATRLAQAQGRTLVAPFLAPSAVEAALELVGDEWLTPERPKAWLRERARSHGLPQALVDRPKRAMQYGSRVHRELQRGRSASPGAAGS